jgi:hypothetical protein
VWRISGSTTQVRDLIAGASAVGWDVTHGWDIAGPFACDLQWQQGGGTHIADAVRQLSGWMEFGKPTGASDGAVLRLPFVNFPIEQVQARVELKTGVRHAKLLSAQAFGTRWTGTFERRDPSVPWQFDLAADQLSSADLDRWLNPRWREGFFDRMLPFLNSRPETSGLLVNVQAIGHLVVGQFALARLFVSRLQADLALHSRRITIANADGRFYGGEVNGSFDANLLTVPSYHADLDFSHVDASALIAAVPSLAGVTAESAGGQISFAARGASRSDLISSLTCQGTARVTHLELLQFDLWKSLEGRSQSKGNTRFPAGSAVFSCSRDKIEFQHVQLVGNDPGVVGSGTVDFKGALDLRFRVDSDSPAPSSSPSREFRLTGALAEPQASWIPPSLPRRSR